MARRYKRRQTRRRARSLAQMLMPSRANYGARLSNRVGVRL